MNKQALNPIVFHQGFQHITEQIFEKVDDKSLKNCREVGKSWQNCIDNQNILWKKLTKKNGGTKTFQLACKNGHSKMARLLIQKATEFEVDLNAKNWWDETLFHLVCKKGNFEIAEMLMNKSTELNIALNSKDQYGRTPLDLACQKGHKNTIFLNNKKVS